MFCKYNEIRKKMRKTNMWKISNIILNNERIKESQEIEDTTGDP